LRNDRGRRAALPAAFFHLVAFLFSGHPQKAIANGGQKLPFSNCDLL
jgi:hypothetical protein